jgi:hypothetical protein
VKDGRGLQKSETGSGSGLTEANGGKASHGTAGGTPALPGTENSGVPQAIGAGADPTAEVQFASGEMPNPQADAAGFFRGQS